MPDDYVDNTQTTGTVTVGNSATGEIEILGDRDWFAVTLQEGKTYQFDLRHHGEGVTALNFPSLHGIYDAQGTLIAGTTDTKGYSELYRRATLTPTETATYYVSVGGNGDRGTYRLWVEDVTVGVFDDLAAGTGTTGSVAVGGSATGEIQFWGDTDWFEVTLVADKTYWFALQGSVTGDGTLTDPYLRGIYDAKGTLLGGTTNDNRVLNKNSRVTFTATASATYYVSAGAYEDGEGTYTLSVVDVTDGVPDDFAAGTGTTGMVAVGSSVTGEIESNGDRDWFEVTLAAGSIYQLDLEGSATDGGTLRDPYLRGIYDAQGNLVRDTTNDFGGIDENSRVVFAVINAGTYYVSAGADRDGEGTYKLSVTDVTEDISDDFEAGTGTTGTVAVGGSATGRRDFLDDYDWFEVTLVANASYRFDLQGTFGDGGTLRNPYLRGIYNAQGALLDNTTNDNDGGGYTDSRVTFTPTTGGTYYVSAGGSGDGEGTYTLSVTEFTDDFDAGTETDGAVTVGSSVTGEIESSGDRDWFEVTLTAGNTYQIDLVATEPLYAGGLDPYLYGIYDAGGDLIDGTTNDNGGSYASSRVMFRPPATATYYVSAGGFEDETDGYTGGYRLSVMELTVGAQDDFSADIGTTGAVTVGGSAATGEIESHGDRDWFSVTLVAGNTYRVDLKGSSTSDGTLSDPLLRGIYNAQGNHIRGTTNDDGGSDLNSRVWFTAPAAGTYYVAAGTWGTREGSYTLSVTDVTADLSDVTADLSDDFTAGTGTTGTVAVGDSATGEIDFLYDQDWFAVTLVAGNTYRVDLEGSSTSDGTQRDPFLRGIYNAQGNHIRGTTNDDGGSDLNSRVWFTAPAAGTYYVAAGAWGRREGSYTLSVTDVTADLSDDFTAGTGTTGTVAVGDSATGEIDFLYDQDWFAVTLVAGTTYRFDLEGSETSDGTLSDPYLRGIYDAAGDYISNTRNDDFGSGYNSRGTFTATENATYYVSAGAYSGVGTYTLSVEEVM